MELASNSAAPITTPEELNSATPNLTKSPVTPNATMTGSNKIISIKTISPCNCRSAITETKIIQKKNNGKRNQEAEKEKKIM